MDKLLLCTDMDRTVIPNGHQAEHPLARERFQQLCALSAVRLVYVTGRDLDLTRKAIADYQLPLPAYAITDVGSKIYAQQQGRWHEMASWQEQIAVDWAGKTRAQLHGALADMAALTLQEASRQNDFKLSYYVALDVDHQQVLQRIEQRLEHLGVAAGVIWSIDEPKQIGLLDVLPRNATKMHGIEFLRTFLNYEREEVLFAGDSGNDLLVMGSPIRSILVANADGATREQALQLAGENGVEDTLYLAREEGFFLGGNYSGGVLQGVAHFAPHIMNQLPR